MIYVLARLEIEPGKMDLVLEAARPCIEATRKEDGCIAYELFRSITDENVLTFVESWESRAALEAHFGQAHLATWRDAAGTYLIGKKIEIIDPASVESL